MTSFTLTKEINKYLPNYSYRNAVAYESKQNKDEGSVSYIKFDERTSTNIFKKTLENLKSRMKSSPYFKQDEYILIFEVDAYGEPRPEQGLYVIYFSTPKEKESAYKTKLTLELASLVHLQKLVLERKTSLLEISKETLSFKV